MTYNKMGENVLILIGQTVRTGTNYVGALMNLHPQVMTLPMDRSSGEFNLFKSGANMERKLFDAVVGGTYSLFELRLHYYSFLPYYGNAWINYLMDLYKIPRENLSEKKIFIKSPVIRNFNLWRKAYPKAKIAVICRDGRDNVESVVRASNDKRSWHTFFTKAKKKINYYSGRSFINASRSWADTADIFIGIKESENVKKFKYEDLLNAEGIRCLLEFYGIDSSDKVIHTLLDAPIIGSSWGVNSGGTKKPNWEPITDKSKFKFTGKWESWSKIKKNIFKTIAGKQLVALGYEKDNTW